MADPRVDVTPVTDPLQEQFADVTIEFRSARTTAALRVAYNDLDYQNSSSPLARQNTVMRPSRCSARFRRAGSGCRRRARSAYIRGHRRSDDDMYAFIGAGWRMRSNLLARLTLRLQKRDSSIPPPTSPSIRAARIHLSSHVAQGTRPQRVS